MPSAARAVTPGARSVSTGPSYGTGRSARMARRQQGDDDEQDPDPDGDGRPPQPEVEGGHELADEEDAADKDEQQADDHPAAGPVARIAAPATRPGWGGSQRDRRAIGRSPAA